MKTYVREMDKNKRWSNQYIEHDKKVATTVIFWLLCVSLLVYSEIIGFRVTSICYNPHIDPAIALSTQHSGRSWHIQY